MARAAAALGRVPDGEDHVCSPCGEGGGRSQADAAGASGDNGGTAGLVGYLKG